MRLTLSARRALHRARPGRWVVTLEAAMSLLDCELQSETSQESLLKLLALLYWYSHRSALALTQQQSYE